MEFFQSPTFIAWAIIPKVTSFMSLVGSSCILYDVFKKENNQRKKLKITTNRIVALMSVCDVMATLTGYFLTTWMIPEKYGVWQGHGNQATCTFQGFVTHFSVSASILFNVALAVSYVLIVRYGWKDEALQKPLMTFLLLVAPILGSLGYNLWVLVGQAYNFTGAWMCTIGPDLYKMRGTEHGDTARIWALITSFVDFVIICLSTLVLYLTVLEKERAMDRFAVGGAVSRTQSNRVGWQGIWYSGSFFMTWTFYWIRYLVYYSTGTHPLWMITVDAFLIPTQGAWNAIVYYRPRWASARRRRANNSRGRSTEDSSSAVERQSGVARRFWGISSAISKRLSEARSRGSSSTDKLSSAAALSTAAADANSGAGGVGLDNTDPSEMSELNQRKEEVDAEENAPDDKAEDSPAVVVVENDEAVATA